LPKLQETPTSLYIGGLPQAYSFDIIDFISLRRRHYAQPTAASNKSAGMNTICLGVVVGQALTISGKTLLCYTPFSIN